MSEHGGNIAFIDELHQRYLADPNSVSEAWREFFSDFRADRPAPQPAQPAKPQASAPTAGVSELPDGAIPLRGIASKIVENMETSLTVPTATSVREIAVKVLEENRRVINRHQVTKAAPKISFTHLLAWFIVRAIEKHPELNAEFREIDGKPHLIPREAINFGLAIDLERKGERVLLVPNVKDAGKLDFPGFVEAYNDLVQRARGNKLGVDDYAGTTVTLTNPGMIGTALSVPRLMSGQGAIFGVGSIGLPAEYAGMAPEMISELGLSKVMTVTSTYDHRVIQGAVSGQFLAAVDALVRGAEGSYERIFQELGVPQEPYAWSGDAHPRLLGASGHSENEAVAKQAAVLSLIRAYRVRGSLWADLDPLDYEPSPNSELELATYGLTAWDLDRKFLVGNLGGHEGKLPLRDILDTLQQTYCWHIGVEYMHIADAEPREWLYRHLEDPAHQQTLTAAEQMRILTRLNAAEAFENFLGSSYIGQKRFSLEGAETVIPMLDFLLSDAASQGVEEAVMGMAHRGRLNVLAHVVGKTYGQIFREFEDNSPESTHGSGDVKYHLGAKGVFRTDTASLRVTLASNPSHLEAVDPVVEGMARALQDELGDSERGRVLPILIHGDAAFAGQGVVAETLQLSTLEGYRTGGTVHIVINNQIGFTTRPQDLRSSHYCTDVAKIARAPIFHVNGDHPEEAVKVIRQALAFRQQFGRDVVVDLVCYRRWGHNEGDDPSYTSPKLYAKIKNHRSVRKLYTEQLLRRGDINMDTAEDVLDDFRDRMREVHDEVRKAKTERNYVEPPEEESVGELRPEDVAETPREMLEEIIERLGTYPEDFEPNPKLARQLAKRGERFAGGKIDWALGEALAFGSLLVEGRDVRLSGEDSGRGTFSQRHAILYDHRDARRHVPLDNVGDGKARFQVFDSLLSEFAVLGFEYGYTVNAPNTLVMWEAQFGDFVNGAQVIIDQFIASAEAKWNQRSNLVMLLPHGYEGQGPEHSSARLERFLTLAAQRNLRIAYPSTPAQYFHLLRSQAHLEERKPLVVMTPKSLLRLPACVSAAEEFVEKRWQFVLDDPVVAPEKARRLVLCTGKVYYDLLAAREEAGIDDVAIARLEYLYPVPADSLIQLFARYGNVDDVVWTQEEPRNMGAWNFVQDRVRGLLAEGQQLRYVGRRRAASPATGSMGRHLEQQRRLVETALAVTTQETAGSRG